MSGQCVTVLLSGGVLRVPGPEAGEEVRRGAPADLRQAEAHPSLQRGHQAHLQGGAMSIVGICCEAVSRSNYADVKRCRDVNNYDIPAPPLPRLHQTYFVLIIPG